MRVFSKWHVPTLSICAGLLCAMATASAQPQFQWVYGGAGEDAARGGVIQTRNGDLISVGESNSFGNGDYDIYVTLTDRCGQLRWSFTYDLGNFANDFGRKIRECDDGSFIIVGTTDLQDQCCRNDRRDIVLLRITADGGVIFASTYGGSLDEEGTDVQVDGREFVVSGRTSSFGNGDYDGLIMRTNELGAMIASCVYGSNQYDSFNSLAILDDGSRDIVAAGVTRFATGREDVLAARLNAGLALNWIYHYGNGEFDEGANSVIVAGRDRIVIAGWGYVQGVWRSGYLLRIAGNGGYINDRLYYNDEIDGMEFKEVRLNACLGLAVTGYYNTNPLGGLGGRDMLLLTTDRSLTRLFSWVYGGADLDEGWSIAVDQFAGDDTDPGYILAGATRSLAAFGGEDLYLVRTNSFGSSSCPYEQEVGAKELQPVNPPQSFPTCSTTFLRQCGRVVEARQNDNAKAICFDPNCVP